MAPQDAAPGGSPEAAPIRPQVAREVPKKKAPKKANIFPKPNNGFQCCCCSRRFAPHGPPRRGPRAAAPRSPEAPKKTPTNRNPPWTAKRPQDTPGGFQEAPKRYHPKRPREASKRPLALLLALLPAPRPCSYSFSSPLPHPPSLLLLLLLILALALPTPSPSTIHHPAFSSSLPLLRTVRLAGIREASRLSYLCRVTLPKDTMSFFLLFPLSAHPYLSLSA